MALKVAGRDKLRHHRLGTDFGMAHVHAPTLEAELVASGLVLESRFGNFLKTVPNSLMLDYPEALLRALDALSPELPPDILANIGVVAHKPRWN